MFRRGLNLLGMVLVCLCSVLGGSIQANAAKVAKVDSTAKRLPIVVVRTDVACLSYERSFTAGMAKQTLGWLRQGGVKADLASDAQMSKALKGRKLAYLVTFQKPTAQQLNAIRQFCKNGGKVAVLQSTSPQMAQLLGIKTDALKNKNNVACISGYGGWWVPNVFSGQDEEEVHIRLVLALAAAAVPGVWDAAAWDARKARIHAAEIDYARLQKPRKNELRAVWDHSGHGLYAGDWPRTMRELKACGITDVFVNVAGAGFAHYPSRVLPNSPLYHSRGDQLAASVAAGHALGIRVHAWLICFNGTHAEHSVLKKYQRAGWVLKDKSGNWTEYLNPSSSGLQQKLLTSITEMAQGYAIDGLHLDFIRWYEKSTKPAKATAIVTAFVKSARANLRAKRPRAWLTVAVLGKYPSCVASVGQDWVAWLNSGLVDYAVAMNYVTNTDKFNSLVVEQASTPFRAKHTLAGIGVTAKGGTLTPTQVINQVQAARKAGLVGVAFFDLDETFAYRVLPLLRMGMFR